MAKRRRNIKKKHNSENQNEEKSFLESVPEKSEEEWANESEPIYSEDEEEEVLHETQEPIEEPVHLVEAQQEPEMDAPSEEQEIHENEFSLGKYLLEQRESQGITLKSVSQSTKISLTNLEFLEADDLSSLPNRAYVTGYVKSYSKLIGLDVNFCLKLLEKTYQSLGAKPREPEIVIPQAQNSPQIENQLPVAKIGAALAMVAVIGAIVIFFVNRKNNAPEIPVVEVPKEEEIKEILPQTLNAETPLQEEITDNSNTENEDLVEEQKTTEVKPVIEKKEEVKAVEEKKEEKKEEEKVVEDKKEEEKKVAEDKKEEKKEERKFYPLNLPLYTVNKDLTSDQIDQLLPASSRVQVQEGKQAVYIRANKGDSWLTYKKDDDPIKKFVLKEGRTLLFVAEEARLFLGNIGGVTIFLNNKPLKITSRTGVKSIVFPQENADKYVMPLFIYKDDGSVMTSKKWIDEFQ